jgi:pimeloyl-ACP methyl ester carboxylesterase
MSDETYEIDNSEDGTGGEGGESGAAPMSAEQAADFVTGLEEQAAVYRTDAGGARIVWRRFGAGPALVLLHGGHGSWLHWVHNIEALALRHTVWVPDMPGYGASDDAPGTDLQSLVGTLVAGIAELFDTEAIDVVGFSFGGLVASHLAAQSPAVRRLGLLGPGGHGGARRQQAPLVDWRHGTDRAAEAVALRQNVEAFMISDPAKVDALAMLAYSDSCRHTRFRSKEISRAGGLGDALDAFAGPVLLAWGEDDVTADPPAVIATLTGAAWPQREARIVPAAGHWVQFEAHHDVNAMLVDWLAA